MADRETLWGWDLDESPADESPADDDYADAQRDPITEPIPVVETDQDVEQEYYEDTATYAGPFINSPPGSPIGSLSFKSAPLPWYRTRKGLIAILAFVAIAIVVAIVPLVLSGSGSDTQQSPSVTPSTAGSSVPTPSVAPSLSSPPAPPPPPPPLPPPPPPDENPPPVTRQYSPRYDTPSQPQKPEIGVTRAPMSVAPEVRTPPSTANPDGKPRGFF